VRPASFSISYDPVVILRASTHAEDLVMLSFAVRRYERHMMVAVLIGCGRKIRAAVANWRHAAIASVTDPYRPELHYMRGPGPKWRQKHATCGIAIAQAVARSRRTFETKKKMHVFDARQDGASPGAVC